MRPQFPGIEGTWPVAFSPRWSGLGEVTAGFVRKLAMG